MLKEPECKLQVLLAEKTCCLCSFPTCSTAFGCFWPSMELGFSTSLAQAWACDEIENGDISPQFEQFEPVTAVHDGP